MYCLDEAGRDAGRTTALPLLPALRCVVEHAWIEQGTGAPPTAPRVRRIVPDVSAHLIYQAHHADGGVRHRLVLVGARSTWVDVDKSTRIVTCGVRLLPGALPALFGIPADALRDQSVPLCAVLGRRGEVLCAQVAEVAEPHGRAAAQVLQCFLADRLDPARVPAARLHAVERMAQRGSCTVRALAEGVGLSARGLQLFLHQQVGLSPKRYLQVQRLLRVLDRGLASGRGCWSRVALEGGYADQPHLIRECRLLLGETPEQFAARASCA